MGRFRKEFRPFDVFVHAYYPASGHASNQPTTQLWVWAPVGSSESSGSGSETFSWSPVTNGYVCPGPGVLEGRHLMIRAQGGPTWVTGATVYRHRRYQGAHPHSTPNPTSEGPADV